MTDLRYPIGRFSPTQPNFRNRAHHIDSIAALPSLMRRAVAGLKQDQLNTPYATAVGPPNRSSTMSQIAT